MPTFNDLPKAVREKIYRMHLVYNEPVSHTEQNQLHELGRVKGSYLQMPPLLRLSKKIEREAAPIFFAENTFSATFSHGMSRIVWATYPRHQRLVRSLIIEVPDRESIGYIFKQLPRFRNLEHLRIRVDEKALVGKMLMKRSAWQRTWEDPTPQQNLAVLNLPGLKNLMEISGIKRVEFVKKIDANSEEYGGPIPGGVLETQGQHCKCKSCQAPRHEDPV
jgi:hypothetical protein